MAEQTGEPTDEPNEPKIERPDDSIEDLEAPEELADEVEGGLKADIELK